MTSATELRRLTDMQRAFVAAYTSEPGAIGKVKEAALSAGYSAKTAHEIGRQALALPHVQAAVFEANRAQISGPLVTLAVSVLRRILEDEAAPIKLRADAAKTILDRGGLPAVRVPDESQRREKALNDMTADELESFIRNGRRALDQADMPLIEGDCAPIEREANNPTIAETPTEKV